ncbi:hypothetical protein [Yoonia sp. 2307UL14-13]|uniref:hypothetical protein n=1 Tax=Yoonia sp. 2307UL14-13 TaxID=3126506 RepID=UPI00309AAACB
MMKPAAALLFFAGIGQSAMACQVAGPPPGGWVDEPMSHFRDGGFSQSVQHMIYEGRAPVDLIGGFVGQRLIYDTSCGASEVLLFLDCRTAEAAIVDGLSHEGGDLALFPGSSIDLIQKPQGALDLRVIGSVDELVQISQSNDYPASLDIMRSDIVATSLAYGFEPYMGCKIHYPESVGAQQ